MKLRVWSLLAALLGLLMLAGLVLYDMRSRDGGLLLSAPLANIGGTFTLTDMNGHPFNSDSLMGKPQAVFFGFTHCPEVCPTTLNDLTLAMDRLGARADDLRAVFITVDPERDSPQVLKDYLQSFDHRFMALTGSLEDIAKVAKSFRVYYAKQPTSDGSYTMDHTALVFLMNRKGQFVGTLDFEENAETKFRKLEKLIASEN